QLTANRDRLEHEQDRLMQAHYADAIPLAVLKREQDRIAGELDQVNRRLDAHHGEYTDARAHLDDALNLLENCADIYARCDDANRRLCNQAFFTKVFIEGGNGLRVENARPLEMRLGPEVNADALTWAANADKARTPALDSLGQGSSLVRWVRPAGLDPAHLVPETGSVAVVQPCMAGIWETEVLPKYSRQLSHGVNGSYHGQERSHKQ